MQGARTHVEDNSLEGNAQYARVGQIITPALRGPSCFSGIIVLGALFCFLEGIRAVRSPTRRSEYELDGYHASRHLPYGQHE